MQSLIVRVVVLVLLVCFGTFQVNASVIQEPQCSTLTCTQDSDCPNLISPNYFPACISGICTNTNPTTLDVGDECDGSQMCRDGLLCSNAGIANGTAVCQLLRSFGCACDVDQQCEGGLCLNNSCDAVRSIGDECTTDLQCGSVCINQTCVLGSINDPCNADKSCGTGFCSSNNTCQIDTRPNCSESNPNGKCSGLNSVCFSGTCYTPNGDIGASCNEAIPFPQCKVTLACLNSVCSQVPEGAPCSNRSQCNSLQDCVCGPEGEYGCYTKIGAPCATIYQEYDDCLSPCTEKGSDEVPNSCASKCLPLKMKFACCDGCATDNSFYRNCATGLVPLQCCSSTGACSQLESDAVCAATNITSPSTPPDDDLGSNAWRSVGVSWGLVCLLVAISFTF